MPIISSLPERYEDGFTELSLLSDETFAAIENALLSVELSPSNTELAAKVATSNNLDTEQIQSIFLSVGGMVTFLEDESDIEEASSDVVTLCIDEELADPANKEKLKSRILVLLKDKKILYAAKANDLITESGNVFLTSRVITDIRPIFDFDLEKSPEVGIIMHNLHIHYQDASYAPHKDFYIALTSIDIQMLMDTLIRAEKKEENLKVILKKSGMTNLIE
jgi:hypothetical protein